MTYTRFLPLIAVALLACGSDPVGPSDISGTYALVSVDGASLPVDVSIGDVNQIRSGSLALIESSPACILLVGVRAQAGDQAPVFGNVDPTCAYTRSRNTVTLTLVGDGFDEEVTATMGTSAGLRTITADLGVWGVMVFREVEPD